MADSKSGNGGDRTNPERDKFLFPRARYYGEFTPEQLAFNANLQEFAQRVALICSLETGGKIPSADAYKQIKGLWKELKQSKSELLDRARPDDVELPPEDGH